MSYWLSSRASLRSDKLKGLFSPKERHQRAAWRGPSSAKWKTETCLLKRDLFNHEVNLCWTSFSLLVFLQQVLSVPSTKQKDCFLNWMWVRRADPQMFQSSVGSSAHSKVKVSVNFLTASGSRVLGLKVNPFSRLLWGFNSSLGLQLQNVLLVQRFLSKTRHPFEKRRKSWVE